MRPILMLILSCFLFSILAALIKYLANYIDPIQQSFFRNFLSVIILLPLILKQKFFVKSKSSFKLLILRALFGGITMILLFKAYSLIPLAQAMAISFSTPLFMYFGSIVFLNEKVDFFKTFLLLIGFFLTLIIIRPDIRIETGTLLALISAFTHACAGLLVKKISYKENVLTLMFSMVLIMTPITLIPSLYVWESPDSLFLIFMLLCIAIIATLGNFFWTKAISLSKLTNLMPFDFTKLIFATLLGFIFFNENIDKITIGCGIGLIICNTFIVDRVKNESP